MLIKTATNEDRGIGAATLVAAPVGTVGGAALGHLLGSHIANNIHEKKLLSTENRLKDIDKQIAAANEEINRLCHNMPVGGVNSPDYPEFKQREDKVFRDKSRLMRENKKALVELDELAKNMPRRFSRMPVGGGILGGLGGLGMVYAAHKILGGE